MATQDPTIHPDAFELAELLRPAWAEISAGIRASGVPVAEGDPDPDPKPDPDPDPKPDPDPDPDPDPKPEDWKAHARKHEREAKKARKEKEELERKLKEREDADKSEQEKAIEKAREEAKAEALTEAQKERRQDRLEVAVTRLATKGIKVGEGDDAKTVKYADADDALLHLERAIARGDIDGDEIYDSEGKVQTGPLTTALAELAERKPHLVADGDAAARPSGDGDAGKGAGAKKSDDDLDVEGHLKKIQKGD